MSVACTADLKVAMSELGVIPVLVELLSTKGAGAGEDHYTVKDAKVASARLVASLSVNLELCTPMIRSDAMNALSKCVAEGALDPAAGFKGLAVAASAGMYNLKANVGYTRGEEHYPPAFKLWLMRKYWTPRADLLLREEDKYLHWEP